MDLLRDELELFLVDVTDGMGRTERREAMGHYIRGLMLDGERKNFEPIASRIVDDETKVQGMRQRLQEAVAVADWDEGEVYRRLQVRALGEVGVDPVSWTLLSAYPQRARGGPDGEEDIHRGVPS